jgi:hypothetical protein
MVEEKRSTKQVLQCTTIIPALGRLRQQYRELEASLGNIARPCLKKKTEKNPTK